MPTNFLLMYWFENFLHHFAGDLTADRDMGEATGELPALCPVNSELPGNVGAELEVT